MKKVYTENTPNIKTCYCTLDYAYSPNIVKSLVRFLTQAAIELGKENLNDLSLLL